MDTNRTYARGFVIRILSMLFGLFLYALGIVLTINANIGYAPWEVFHIGLANHIGFTLGITSIFVGFVIVVTVTLLKEKLGLGTIASMFLTGIFIDLIRAVNIIPVVNNFAVGIVMLAAGLFVTSTGSFFYMRSAFGAGPRDNLMVVLSRRTKMPIGVCRGIVELTVTIVGWLLGGMVGIGTVIAGFAIGFCIQITFTLLKFDAKAVPHETLRQTLNLLLHKTE